MAKISINIYKEKDLKNLYLKTQFEERIDQYFKGSFDFLDDLEALQTPLNINTHFPKLIKDNGSNDDAENSIKFYKNIGDLPVDLSTDSRFWIHLTHNEYRDYTYKRWCHGDINKGTIQDAGTTRLGNNNWLMGLFI